MTIRDDLLQKSRDFRKQYYGKEPPKGLGHEMCPEVMQLIEETLFGHIYQRPQVDIKTRSLCTIAALTALNREKQLPGHIIGALNSGVTKQEIVEIIVQLLFLRRVSLHGECVASCKRNIFVLRRGSGRRRIDSI